MAKKYGKLSINQIMIPVPKPKGQKSINQRVLKRNIRSKTTSNDKLIPNFR